MAVEGLDVGRLHADKNNNNNDNSQVKHVDFPKFQFELKNLLQKD